MKDKITTIRVKESTKKQFKKLKTYSRETDDETLIQIIKDVLATNEVKQ